ncbi:MAG: Phosphatase yqaB (EC [uncultured Paraburkholderia sp.]|nr:MAG: Phosphatase yqaB (EC [uncultured Paraburkholderia sp.]CAH2930982.1 MAG: Phosphatase yqaB (EC [uncultured Paraburkholderia sp.]
MRIRPHFCSISTARSSTASIVYQHVLAWKEALDSEGISLSVWRIHRKIGMSGGLFTNQLLRETHGDISAERGECLRHAHAAAYKRLRAQVCPLPGARELLDALTQAGTPWAVATSGRMETAAVNLEALSVDPSKDVVVTRDDVKYAKPDPDLFIAAAERLGVEIEHSVVVGDSIWDMLAARRCRALGYARKSWSAPARSGSTTTRRRCSIIWTKWPRGRNRRRRGITRLPHERAAAASLSAFLSVSLIRFIQAAYAVLNTRNFVLLKPRALYYRDQREPARQQR